MKNLTSYRLKDFIISNQQQIKINPFDEYKQIKLRLYQNGAELRGNIKGNEIRSKQYIAKEGQFIISKIDARNGAMGIVPEDLNGAVVTGDFLLFDINKNIVDRNYFDFYTRLNSFDRECKFCSEGSTNRVRLKVDKFLNISILLPPLSEQRLIVSQIESVKQRIKQINILISELLKEIDFLRNSLFFDLQKEYNSISIGNIIIANNEIVQIESDKTYKQVTVRMEHKGVLLRGMQNGNDIGSKQFLAHKDNFIISKIDARNGAMGMIPENLEGAVVTNDFPLFSFIGDLNPKFFYYFTNTIYFDDACKKASEGSTNRKRLKMDRFAKILIPFPPIEDQNRIVEVLNKLNEIKNNHKQQEQELAELMPALLDKAFKGEL